MANRGIAGFFLGILAFALFSTLKFGACQIQKPHIHRGGEVLVQ